MIKPDEAEEGLQSSLISRSFNGPVVPVSWWWWWWWIAGAASCLLFCCASIANGSAGSADNNLIWIRQTIRFLVFLCNSKNRLKCLHTLNDYEMMVINAWTLTERMIAAMDVTISCDLRAFENKFSAAIAVTDPWREDDVLIIAQILPHIPIPVAPAIFIFCVGDHISRPNEQTDRIILCKLAGNLGSSTQTHWQRSIDTWERH